MDKVDVDRKTVDYNKKTRKKTDQKRVKEISYSKPNVCVLTEHSKQMHPNLIYLYCIT